MTAFPFAVVATLFCLALWGFPAAVIAAAFTFPVAFTVWGIRTIERGKAKRVEAERARRSRKKNRFTSLHDNLQTLSTMADGLCQTQPSLRSHKRAALLADRLEDACNNLVHSGIDFDEVGDGEVIRQAIAWARTSVDILRRDQPDHERKAIGGTYDVEYVDRRGARTERRIQLRTIELTAGQIYLWAWCELRDDIRKFRAEGFEAMINAESGEIIDIADIPRWLDGRLSVAAE